MHKRRYAKHPLVRTLLASTVFISAAAHANTYGPGSTPGPIQTSTQFDNIIEVLPSGQITSGILLGANDDATILDSFAGKIIVDPNNFYVGKDAILAFAVSGGPSRGVHITNKGQTGTVTVGIGSGIHATSAGVDVTDPLNPLVSDAIYVDVLDTVITNQGTIASDFFSAIHINEKVTNTKVNNLLGGVITNSATGTTPTILTDAFGAFFKGGSTLDLNNKGIIQSISTVGNTSPLPPVVPPGIDTSSIRLNAYFSKIDNEFGGQILQRVGGNANNIEIIGPDFIGGSGGGNIINEVGGLIYVPNFLTLAPPPFLLSNILISGTTIHDIINHGDIVTVDGYHGITVQSFEDAGTGAFLDAAVNKITNTGLIASLGKASGDAIHLDATTGDAPPSRIVTINEIRNSGTIFSNNMRAIGADPNSGTIQFTHGIFNTGDIITGNQFNYPAIGNPTFLSLFQQRGLIVGNVEIDAGKSPASFYTLYLSGGVISGDFLGPINDISNILVTGGNLTGLVSMRAPINTVDMTGGEVSKFRVDDDLSTNTWNISGGHFNQINGDEFFTNANNQLFINGPVNSGVIQFVQTIKVQYPYTLFNIEAPIIFDRLSTMLPSSLQLTGFTHTRMHAPIDTIDGIPPIGGSLPTIFAAIDPNARLDIIGDQIINFSDTHPLTFFRNSGTLGIDSESSLLLMVANDDGFVMTDNGVWEVSVNGLMNNVQDHSKIVVQSRFEPVPLGPTDVVDFQDDSTIFVSFKGFLPANSSMTILTLNSPTDQPITTTDLSDLQQQPSAVISFSKQLSEYNQDIILVSHRRLYNDLSYSGATFGLSETLDNLAEGAGPTNPDLFFLLSELDQLTTRQDVERAMQSLAPPFNNGIQSGSHLAMKTVFDSITDRIWDFAWPYRFQQTSRPPEYPWDIFGFNGGDLTEKMHMWISPMGIYADQGSRQNVLGYKAKGLGLAIGADWVMDRCTVLGLAGSFVKLHVSDQNIYQKNESIKSWQGSLYGSFEFCYGMYLDAILGASGNNYHLNRVIAVNTLNTAARSTFSGFQWGSQVDLGMVWPTNNRYMVAPFIRLDYFNVGIDDYLETGAGALNLKVTTPTTSNLTGGIGIHVATNIPYYCCELVPEISLMFGYAFQQSAAVSIAAFEGGGLPFATPNALPRRTLMDVGVGFDILTAAETVLTFQYNGEFRNRYFANAGSIQYTFKWG